MWVWGHSKHVRTLVSTSNFPPILDRTSNLSIPVGRYSFEGALLSPLIERVGGPSPCHLTWPTLNFFTLTRTLSSPGRTGHLQGRGPVSAAASNRGREQRDHRAGRGSAGGGQGEPSRLGLGLEGRAVRGAGAWPGLRHPAVQKGHPVARCQAAGLGCSAALWAPPVSTQASGPQQWVSGCPRLGPQLRLRL